MDDLALALTLADLADAVTLPRFRATDLVVAAKPDRTPVSDADRDVEQVVRAHLAGERPADAVVGEEYGETGSAARRWIVDPVDGTQNFVRGIPVWATLIALESAGIVTVGVVSAPALGRRWWALRGGGAHAGPPGAHTGDPIRVSAVADLADAHFGCSGLARWEPLGRLAGLLDLVGACRRTRGFGDFWSHVLVAEGALDLAAEPEVSLWDLAALQVVVEEAGGRFTDLSGRATPAGGSAVSSNGRLHDVALARLAPR